MPSILDLPAEILSLVFAAASAAAPTRQKRRQELLRLGRVCRVFNAVVTRQIYSKLAYEISSKGHALLRTLESSSNKYERLVQALAIRERDNVQRRIVNSRSEKMNNAQASSGTRSQRLITRAKQDILDAVISEEEKIARVLAAVKGNFTELKYETNLLPENQAALADLAELRSLTVVAQPSYHPANITTREDLVAVATFTLSLPGTMLLQAFGQWQYLTEIDMWKCSLDELDNRIQEVACPNVQLKSITMTDCKAAAPALRWLLKNSLDIGSLETFRIAFIRDTTDADHTLHHEVQNIIRDAARSLRVLSIEGDEKELDSPKQNSVDTTLLVVDPPSPFSSLKKLDSLRLGGRAITTYHWQAIPKTVFAGLKNLELEHTPLIPPDSVVDTLEAIPVATSSLRTVTVHGSEPNRRRNFRDLLHLGSGGDSEWVWSRMNYGGLVSISSALDVQLKADRAVAVGGDDDDDDDPSSDYEVYGAADIEGDFVLTAEQIDEEKRIEAEERERIWESGSEY